MERRRLPPVSIRSIALVLLLGAGPASLSPRAAAATAPPLAHPLSSADGAWSMGSVVMPAAGHTAIFDAARDRMIVWGGYGIDEYHPYQTTVLSNETWAWSRSPTPQWSELDAVNPADSITGRASPSSILDPVRDRMILFGGWQLNGETNEVWTLPLSGGTWSHLVPLGTPPTPRQQSTTIYDPVRDRLIVLGGLQGSTFYNDVWALSLSGTPTWSQLTPVGGAPYVDVGVYDPVNDRIVIVSLDSPAAVWELSLSGSPTSPTWTRLTPSGTAPALGYYYTAVYSPIGQRLVLFGGMDVGTFDFLGETKALSLTGTPTWSDWPLSPKPSGRYNHSAVLDPGRLEMIVFAGDANNAYMVHSDLWTLSLSGPMAWNVVAPDVTSPPTSTLDLGIYDPVRDCFYVAGYSSSGMPTNQYGYSGRLHLGGLSFWEPGVGGAEDYSTGIYDPRLDGVVTFGGADVHEGDVYNSVSVTPFSGQPRWYVDPGPLPPPSIAMVSVLDPIRYRMIIIGGGTPNGVSVPGNEVWALSLSSPHVWAQLSPSGPALPPRYGHAVAYDPVRDRLLVYGGTTGTTGLNDVWGLDLARAPAWTQLSPTGSPPPAGSPRLGIYDPIRDRLVVFVPAGVWALALSPTLAWSQLAPSGTQPPTGYWEIQAIYDPIRDRLVMQQFEDYGHCYECPSRTWTLTWGQASHPEAASDFDAASLPPGGAMSVTYSVTNVLAGARGVGWKLEGDRRWPGLPLYGLTVVDSGGTQSIPLTLSVPDTAAYGSNQLRFTTWYEGALGLNASHVGVLQVVPTVGAEGAAAMSRLALEGPRPNPALSLRVSFVLPDSRPAEIEAFDVAGRVVAHQRLAGLGPGRHELALGGESLAPGVYVIRLRQGTSSVATRAVIMR